MHKNPFHLWAQHVPNMKCYSTKKKSISSFAPGGCSSAGRAGRLMIERSLVQIPAQGKAELHVEVSLSKILNPPLLISEGLRWAGDLSREYPALALRQGGMGLLQQQHPATTWKGISGYGQWHDMIQCAVVLLIALIHALQPKSVHWISSMRGWLPWKPFYNDVSICIIIPASVFTPAFSRTHQWCDWAWRTGPSR